MKQPGAEAKLRRLLASILQIMGEVPAHGDGQGRSLFAKNFGDPPSLLADIFGNPSAQDLRVEVRRVAVIRILDKHPVGRERQQIDEAIAIVLGHAGVHDHRPFETVRRIEQKLLPQEFLPAKIEQRQIARPAPIKDRSEEHQSELQSLMRTSYAVFCLKKK